MNKKIQEQVLNEVKSQGYTPNLDLSFNYVEKAIQQTIELMEEEENESFRRICNSYFLQYFSQKEIDDLKVENVLMMLLDKQKADFKKMILCWEKNNISNDKNTIEFTRITWKENITKLGDDEVKK